MTCYALACRQALACATPASCERVWHACTPPNPSLCVDWRCTDCRALWCWRLGADGGEWHREPLPNNLTGV